MIPQPKFWKSRNFISNILLPLSFFYILISSFKNYFEKKFQSKLTIICVGNLTIGGSGKTPTVIYIAELLKAQWKKYIGYKVSVFPKFRLRYHFEELTKLIILSATLVLSSFQALVINDVAFFKSLLKLLLLNIFFIVSDNSSRELDFN